MKAIYLFVITLMLQLCFTKNDQAFGRDWVFGIGLQTGVSRLEGDTNNAKLSPLISGHLMVLPLPYLAINGEFGFTPLDYSNNPTNFKTNLVPFELSAIFNFLPFKKINPYIFAGGGGVYWSARATIAGSRTTLQDGIDSFLKTGVGLEYRVSETFGINLGATFRYSLTDAFEQIWSGDEKDQVLDVHAGFTYYFNKTRNDRDHDLIPDELDLMPDIAEDKDGYLDHDGIPEKNPNPVALNSYDFTVGANHESSSPIVIHHLISKAEAGSSVPIKSFVYSNIDLRVVAILYRPLGTPNWNVVRMSEHDGNLFEGEIPGYAVTTEGFEYCVVAVDETLSGIGYSGLPSKPIRVKVSPSGKPWRFLGGTIGAATIGTASYLILRKQQN
ncbi:MAG: outer membrane beta-barrel protein [bacterium]